MFMTRRMPSAEPVVKPYKPLSTSAAGAAVKDDYLKAPFQPM